MGFKRIYVSFLLLILVNLLSCNRVKSDYKSSARDAYFDSVSKSRKLEKLKNKVAVEFQSDFVTIVTLKDPALLIRKDENDYFDSLAKAKKIDLGDQNGIAKVFYEIGKLKTGPIVKQDIVKYGKLKTKQAIIYIDGKYNDCFEKGYWIALSNDDGKNWKKYFTGLTVNKNYYFKSNSKIPLWKNPNTLQMEAVIVKKISDRILPGKSEEYRTIRDSIAVQFDLSKIILDSDNDGLTDVIEERMLLDPSNPDTDGDGIIDSKDKNPRFKTKKTAKSILYEVLMGNYKFENQNSFQINLQNLPKSKYLHPVNTDAISIFITDDVAVQGLELEDETLVVMTSKEYEDYKLKHPFSFSIKEYSKMFLCDNESDKYVIVKSSCMSGSEYVVKKTTKGWEVTYFMKYII